MTKSYPVKAPKKLIEVALPLDDINEAAAREKSIRHGHPSTLHLWWARRPLAAARAVIFSQLVNDPSWRWELEHPGETPTGAQKGGWATARKRLFKILSDLVKWESTTNEAVLEPAREEIRKSWRETCEVNKDHPQAAELFNPDKMPGLHDPFAGGGAIPLEAQRLGLDAYASDLNPVAVLINKAMIEIPPKFAGRPPVGPVVGQESLSEGDWSGAKGLAEDVRRYGAWMRAEAEKRIGHLYPQVEITKAMVKERPDLKQYEGQKLTVIAWLWARTVKSPSPAFSHVDVPLASTFVLSSKDGKQSYVDPVVKGDSYQFVVKTGKPPASAKDGTKLSRGANFKCIMSDEPIESKHIYAEANAGRMGTRLMAVVLEGARARVYVEPTVAIESTARNAVATWRPELAMPQNPRWFSPPLYGLTTYGDLFTSRQLVALTTFSDLIGEVRVRAHADARAAGMADDSNSMEAGGTGAAAYADALCVYLASAISKAANIGSSIATWMSDRGAFRETFARQAIPMSWDFAESNPLADSGGSFFAAIDKGSMALDFLPAKGSAKVWQADASASALVDWPVVVTDPPYYDNIGYADLSDFFYVWLRRSLSSVLPRLFLTLATPKKEELIASPSRHSGGMDAAETFFLSNMTATLSAISAGASPSVPISIFYAFKQSDTDASDGTSSTGWETFLEAVIRAGLSLSGTWPMRTEGAGRLIAKDTNALASSVVLVCRSRSQSAPSISRREFVRELNKVLPEALDQMTKGSGDERSPVAPVDLSQAIIGPGMAVFSRYTSVLEADGQPMRVRTALQLINRFLAEDDFDADTQFCLHWFDQYGWAVGDYGEADVLARAKATSVNGLVDAGVVKSGAGKLNLLKWADYAADWNPSTDKRLPVWEALHQLIRALRKGGEGAAAPTLAAVQDRAESIRQLAYRLYTLCERKGMAEDARAYNELVTSWNAIELAANSIPKKKDSQLKMFS